MKETITKATKFVPIVQVPAGCTLAWLGFYDLVITYPDGTVKVVDLLPHMKKVAALKPAPTPRKPKPRPRTRKRH